VESQNNKQYKNSCTGLNDGSNILLIPSYAGMGLIRYYHVDRIADWDKRRPGNSNHNGYRS